MKSVVPHVQKLVDLLTSYIPLSEKNEAETRAMADEDFTGAAFDAWYANEGAAMRKIEESIAEAAQEAIQAMNDVSRTANVWVHKHVWELQTTGNIRMISVDGLRLALNAMSRWIKLQA